MPLPSFIAGNDDTERPAGKSPLRPRVFSALALSALALAGILLGPPYLQLLLAAAAFVLSWEWLHLCGDPRDAPTAAVFGASLVAAVALSYAGAFGIALAVVAGGTVLVYVLSALRGRESAVWTAAGVPYIGLPCLAMAWIWVAEGDGRSTVLWIVAAIAATDSGAYFVGRNVGGPRLAPTVSPRKTWAGLFGGMACAALVGLAAGAWAGVAALWAPAATSAALAVVSQGGDLVESGVKRHFGVKDMSGIIPGHGGMFDRVDGLIAALVAAALVQLITERSVLTWQ